MNDIFLINIQLHSIYQIFISDLGFKVQNANKIGFFFFYKLYYNNVNCSFNKLNCKYDILSYYCAFQMYIHDTKNLFFLIST